MDLYSCQNSMNCALKVGMFLWCIWYACQTYINKVDPPKKKKSRPGFMSCLPTTIVSRRD